MFGLQSNYSYMNIYLDRQERLRNAINRKKEVDYFKKETKPQSHLPEKNYVKWYKKRRKNNRRYEHESLR